MQYCQRLDLKSAKVSKSREFLTLTTLIIRSMSPWWPHLTDLPIQIGLETDKIPFKTGLNPLNTGIMIWMSCKWRFLTNKYHLEWFNTRRKALYSSAENWKDFHSFKSSKEWNCNWRNLEAKSWNTNGQTTNWITHIAQKVRSEVHRKSTFRKPPV